MDMVLSSSIDWGEGFYAAWASFVKRNAAPEFGAGSLRRRHAGASSYQSSCSDHPAHRRHDVHRHRCAQPGQFPRVSNVFQIAPQLANGGSGLPSVHTHDHRLEGAGRHAHSGHRMRLKMSSSSGATSRVVVRVRDRSRFSAWISCRS